MVKMLPRSIWQKSYKHPTKFCKVHNVCNTAIKENIIKKLEEVRDHPDRKAKIIQLRIKNQDIFGAPYHHN